jgi:hypothetical protein
MNQRQGFGAQSTKDECKMRGIVKTYNAQRGFGFLKANGGGGDVFFIEGIAGLPMARRVAS